jgi:hypothetical protein
MKSAQAPLLEQHFSRFEKRHYKTFHAVNKPYVVKVTISVSGE